MLKFGEFIYQVGSYDKYRHYRVLDIKNEKLSYLVGGFFSKLALNPQIYIKEAWKEYKYIAYATLSVPAVSFIAYKTYKKRKELKAKI